MKDQETESEKLKRPPVQMICYADSNGNPHTFTRGCGGITDIRETEESGEYAFIPWIEIWKQNVLVARFNQHKLEHIFYSLESHSSQAYAEQR